MTDFLDKNICNELRNTVILSNIFHRDSKEKENYNLICAVMDRVDSSIFYLNQHNQIPQTDDDFLLFMIYACIINDATKEILSKLNIKDESICDKNYFKDICMSSPLKLDERSCPSDIKFFEYFRSLVFAHPFDTSRASFLKDNKETHYSPLLITNDNSMKKGCVGIMIYSNRTPKSMPMYIPFINLQDYIKKRYEMLSYANNELKKRIERKNQEWKKQKINRQQPPEKILQDIGKVLKSRYLDTYEVDLLIKILEYESPNSKNIISVKKIQEVIIGSIQQMCDNIESLNYEEYNSIVDGIIYAFPKHSYETLIYDREKIFSYLSDSVDIKTDKLWGLHCAENFSRYFAKKWVDINAKSMSYDEIKLLTITACYLELQAEKETINE